MTAPAPHDPKTLAALAAMSRRGSRAARGLLHAALSDPTSAAAFRGALSSGGEPAGARGSAAEGGIPETSADATTVSESAIAGWIVVAGSAVATLLLLFAMTRLTVVKSPDPPSSVAPVQAPTPTEAPAPQSAPEAGNTAKPHAEPAPTAPIPVVTPVVPATAAVQPHESPAARAQANWLARVESSRGVRVGSLPSLGRLQLLERLSALNLVAEQLARGDVAAASAELELIPEVPPPSVPPVADPPAPRDGVLEGTLRSASQGSSDRAGKIRAFLASSSAAIGPRDAGALVEEALRGVTEGSRRSAQEAILARYRESDSVAVAVLNELGDAHDHRASVDFLSRWTGVDFAPGTKVRDDRVRAAVLARAVQVAASDAAALAEAERALTAVLRRRVGLVAEPAIEHKSPQSAQQSLAGCAPEADIRSLERRVASADGAIQRFVAAQTELINARVRKAAGSSAGEAAAQIAERAKRVRQVDSDVLAQAITNELALLDLAAAGVSGGVGRGYEVHEHPPEPRAYDQALDLLEEAEVLSDGAPCGSKRWNQARILFARAAATDRQGLARSAFLGLAELEERCAGDGAPGERALAAAARAAARMQEQSDDVIPLDEAARASFAQALAEFRLGNAARLANRLKKREVALVVEAFGFGLPDGTRRVSELAAARQNRPPELTNAEIGSMLLVEQAALGLEELGWAHDLARTSGAPLPELDTEAPWSAWLPPDYSEGR